MPTLVALVALFGLTLSAAENGSHIRVVDAQLTTLVDQGAASSNTFHSIVARLDAARLVVVVRCRTRHEPAASAAGLEFLANTPTFRYVRVFIRCDLPATVAMPLLAHEFQHALEVADATDIVNAATLRLHYQRIGYRSNADDRMPSFDTSAAIDVQRRVTAELAHTRQHTVASVDVPTHVWR